MNQFILVAALMTACALLFVLPPLLRKQAAASGAPARDQANLAILRDQMRELDLDRAGGVIGESAYADARLDLERRVADDVHGEAAPTAAPARRRLALAVGLALPVAATALYLMLGTPAGLEPAQRSVAREAPHEIGEAQIAAMVNGLAERLKNRPNDIEGWNMLARSYNALGRFNEAVAAYAHLLTLAPDNADVLADYADALAMTLNKSLQGEPEKLIARALKADPNHMKALSLAASAAFDRRDYNGAIVHWQKLLTVLPADSDAARSTQGNIAEARALAGMPVQAPLPGMQAPAPGVQATAPALADNGAPATGAAGMATAAADAAPAPAAAKGGGAISGSVDVDPALRAQLGENDSVFIFARAASGPRFPLAVLRKQGRDVPLRFTLDDSMSMAGGAKLSSFGQVVVGVRVSKSGNATPSAGDLEGLSEPVKPGATGLQLHIASVHR